eukprot:m.37523 g.37523  ORF g.37523 m.37523 type:complete len:124 (-) comp10106_c0_seq1:161-532(-)
MQRALPFLPRLAHATKIAQTLATPLVVNQVRCNSDDTTAKTTSKVPSLPVCCGDGPMLIEVEAGKRVSWCSCGLSATQPLCDGAHKGTEFKPIRFIPEDSGTLAFCMCKKTLTPPFCDGSHNK